MGFSLINHPYFRKPPDGHSNITTEAHREFLRIPWKTMLYLLLQNEVNQGTLTDLTRDVIWLIVQKPSWKIWVRQWEGWHSIYEMENQSHVWNHQSVMGVLPIKGDTSSKSNHNSSPHRGVYWDLLGICRGDRMIFQWAMAGWLPGWFTIGFTTLVYYSLQVFITNMVEIDF